MGIRRLTYKDIPPLVRAKAAGEAQRRLQAVLSDPTASEDQRGAARRQQGILRQWEAGTLQTEGSSEAESGETVAAVTSDS